MKHRRGRRKKKGVRIKRFFRKLANWFKGLSKPKKAALIAGIVLLILIVAALAFVVSKYNKMDTEKFDDDEIIINELEEEVGVGYTNFVLFGSDSRSDDVTKNLNTDTIIIVSLNNATKEVKMVSVYRDTLLDVKNGSIQKCNSAYARGGAKQAINMLNMNLDLNIQRYVTVNFSAVVDIVDLVGGIEVDVTAKEAKEINKYIDETAMVSGKKANHLTGGGLQTLDGVQATTYARIRKGVGDDYARTERQRLVIQKVVEKILKTDLGTVNEIIDVILPQISTNFTMSEIASYAAGFAKYKFGENSGFPFEQRTATISGRGSCVYPTDLKSNVSELHEFLFGTVDYQPSSKVSEISDEIAYLVSSKRQNSSSSDDETDDETTEGTEGTTDGSGDGTTGDGSGDGTGDGSGDGTGDGTGNGTGDGSGDGTGDGNGDGTGDGTGDGATDGEGDEGSDDDTSQTTPTNPPTTPTPEPPTDSTTPGTDTGSEPVTP